MIATLRRFPDSWRAGHRVMLAVVAAALGLAYGNVFATLITQWRANSEYSHGFLVPFMSFYLLWAQRDALARLVPAPSPALGWPVVAAGLTMLVIGQAGGLAAVASVSLLVTLPGVVLLLFGPQTLRLALFPIAFLIFMIPVWGTLTQHLHQPFQLLAANGAVALLQLIGVPAHREGVLIELPRITLEVARVCSGVNYLIAVLAVAVTVAYLYLSGWRRFALVVLALGIGALSNGVRVALVGLLAYQGFDGPLHGPGHALQAMAVSISGYMGVFVGLWALSRGQRTVRSRPVASERRLPTSDHLAARPPMIGALAVALVLLAAAAYPRAVRSEPVALQHELSSFPARLGAWRAVPKADPTRSAYRDESADDQVQRTYVDTAGREATLYLGYHAVQRQGKELVSHRIGAGLDTRPTSIAREGEEPLVVNRFATRDGRDNRVGVFWYVLDGRGVVDAWEVRAWTAWRGVLGWPSHGAIVMVTVEPSPGEARDAAFDRAVDLAREAAPAVAAYLAAN